MKYVIALSIFLIVAGSWYTETQTKVYACSEAGNPLDVVKQCNSITRWQSWVKK